MSFSGFSPAGIDLLIENRVQNNKTFYDSIKPQLQTLVFQPFYDLIEQMTPQIQQIDSQIEIHPKRMVSRVRRDTRFSKDPSLYRDHVWMTFSRKKGQFCERPVFYFEIAPDFWGYGCGYYHIPSAELQLARDMMQKEDPIFMRALSSLPAHIKLFGEPYKRPKFPNAPAHLSPWLNRKNLGVCIESTDHAPLWDASFLPAFLQDLQSMTPLFHFFCTVKERCLAGRGNS